MSVIAPKLRFSGFNQLWQKQTLGDFMTFKNGVNADKSMYGSGRKFINVLDVIAPAPITHDRIIGSVTVSDKEFAKNEVQYGDILFQRSSETREEVGQSNVYLDKDKTATFGGFVIRGRATTEFDPMFFHALLRTDKVRDDMTSRSGGSTRYNIGQDSLTSVPVHVPSLPEQKKIAAFLSAIDAKIAALAVQQNALGRFKAGQLQKLFTQQLRFTRNDGTAFPDWKEKRLGEVFTWVKTNSLSREFLTHDGGEIQNIHYGDIHTRFRPLFRQSSEKVPFVGANSALKPFTDEEYCRVGDVVIADASEDYADIGKAIEIVEVRERSLVAGLHTYIARPKIGSLVVGFSGYLLRSAPMRRQIMRIAQGISVLGVSKGNLEALTFWIPHPDEQQKIADALAAMDTKIQAVADQVTKLQTFKKGLLQQMFV